MNIIKYLALLAFAAIMFVSCSNLKPGKGQTICGSGLA